MRRLLHMERHKNRRELRIIYREKLHKQTAKKETKEERVIY